MTNYTVGVETADFKDVVEFLDANHGKKYVGGLKVQLFGNKGVIGLSEIDFIRYNGYTRSLTGLG